MMKGKNELLWLGIIILIILPIFIGIIYIINYGVNVPFLDEWDMQTSYLMRYLEDGLSLMDFFAQHNESRPFFPRLILLISDVITGYNMVIDMSIVYILYCMSFIIIFLMYRKDHRINKASLLAFAPLSWFFFNLYQMGNMLFGIFLTSSLMLLGFLGAVYLLDASNGLDKKFVTSLAAAIIASFSFIAGLTVWPVCLIQLALQESDRKSHRLVIWAITAGITFGIYFYGYQKPGQIPPPVESLQHPLQMTLVFLSSFGIPILKGLTLSPIAGILMLIIIVFLLFNSWMLNDKILIDKNIKWFSLVLFSVIASLEIALARTGLSLEIAISQRYYWEEILSVIGLYCLSLNLAKPFSQCCKNFAKRGDMEKQDPNGNSFHPLSYILLGAVIALIFIGTAAQTVEGLKEGSFWKHTKMEMAYYLKTIDIQPDKNLMLLHPVPQHVRIWTSFLKKYNLSVFREKDTIDFANLRALNAETKYSIDAINNRILPLINNSPFIISGDEILIKGWAIDDQRKLPAKAVFIAIDDKFNIPAMYGLERNDVAKFFQNDDYKYSGFKVSFMPTLLGNGSHDLAIKVVTKDGKGYYKADFNKIFMVNGSQIYVSQKVS
ncbi:MAG: hypothetical protein MUO26_16110 [Methanotrichaceae archaeon]|nr:hypothetical protein [Methanotrichaceae archaeon]